MSISATTGQLAQLLQGELVGRPDLTIDSVSGLEQAGPTSLSFIRSGRYAGMWSASRAPAAVVTRGVSVPGHDPAARALIVVENADLAMLGLLRVIEQRAPMHRPGAGVDGRAVVDASAKLGAGVRVGPGCVVGPGAEVGDGSTLMANVSLGAGVRVGPACTLHPGVVVYDRCVLGARVILHAGVVIGADGFGYLPDPASGSLLKVPHVGTVEIGDDVEIGANSCVDRGKFGATTIGAGTKIDNLVQIGHNCRIGRSAAICGMTGVAGSVTIGDGTLVLGHVGIGDGIHIGSRARIGAKSGVFEDVPDGASWSGLPAAPHRQQMRSWAAVRRLPEVMRALKRETDATDAAGAQRRDLER